MAQDRKQIEALLKEIRLFSPLDDQQIAGVAHLFSELSLNPEESLSFDENSERIFFIVMEGEVSVSRKIESDEEPQFDILMVGDFYGEEALLDHQLSPATISALTPTRLLYIDRDLFNHLVSKFPQIKTSLTKTIASRRFSLKHHFDWLNKEELVFQVRQKHVSYFILVQLIPFFICLFAIMALIFGIYNFTDLLTRNISLVLGGLLLIVGIGWSVWGWIDWKNDYYIVTNQRVVWIEKVIWLYESRVEAPLNTITAVNVRTTFWGRLLGFGDILVTTYVGKIPLRLVGDPHEMASIIEEYWHRAKSSHLRSQQNELEQAVNRIINPEMVQKSYVSKSIPQPDSWTLKELTPWEKYFGNILNMRFEQGSIITYRKHWINLVRRTLKPLLVGCLLFVGISIYTILFTMDYITFFSPAWVDSIGIILIILVIFPWLLYNYIDWRNDIYQLTEENIFDIERKPFGTELKKSASLENILSLEHERPGFLGYLFNVGTVIINVGDSKLLFQDVHEPARIQQDIFNRMHMLRTKKEKVEIGRERDRIISLLEIYHRDIENHRQED